MHVFFPGRYDVWYALALGIHFLLGPVIFLLIDTLQRGRRRWLAFALALLFIFDLLQTASNIMFPTGTDHRIFLFMALLSLWSYTLFVRGRRRELGWYIVSVLTYTVAIMTYEQSFFFLLLHPMIAIIEDRWTGAFSRSPRYLWTLLRDVLLQGCLLLIYIYLIMMLFSGRNFGMDLSLSHIAAQMLDGLALVFSPIGLLERMLDALAMGQWWFIGLLALFFFGLFYLWIGEARADSDTRAWGPGTLIVFGGLMAALTALNSAPTTMPFAQNPRLLFGASVGAALVGLGALAALVEAKRPLGRVIFAGSAALVLATGISSLYEYQALYWQQDRVSNRAYQAIWRAIPEFAAGAEPYLLLLADAHPEKALALHPRDVNFPKVFALHYGIPNFSADAILLDHAESDPVAQIQLRADGIVSPLKPQEIVSYDRLLIVSYNSGENSAQILDRLPADILQRGNFDIQTAVSLETNWSLLP